MNKRHLETLKAKAELTEKEIKRKETYNLRLEKKQAAVAEDMEQLDARRVALEATVAQETDAIKKEKIAVRAPEQMATARAAKDSYESGVNAIEAVFDSVNRGGLRMFQKRPFLTLPLLTKSGSGKLFRSASFCSCPSAIPYKALPDRIGYIKTTLLNHECDKWPDAKTHDLPEAKQMLAYLGYDSDWDREPLEEKGVML